jgi:hypothetical protein
MGAAMERVEGKFAAFEFPGRDRKRPGEARKYGEMILSALYSDLAWHLGHKDAAQFMLKYAQRLFNPQWRTAHDVRRDYVLLDAYRFAARNGSMRTAVSRATAAIIKMHGTKYGTEYAINKQIRRLRQRQ